MALEQKVETEYAGKAFGIEPSHDYDRKEFVKAMGAREDVAKEYKKYTESHGSDVESLMKLAGYSSEYHPGAADPNERFKELWTIWSKNPMVTMDYARNALLEPGEEKLAKYVERNRTKMLDELDEGKLHQLWASIPLYKTGDKELDRAAELRDKVMQIQKAMKEEGSIDSVIQNEMETLMKNIPEEQKGYIFRNADLVFPGIRNAILRRIQIEFSGLFRDKDGNLDKKLLVKAIGRNYDAANDFMEDRIPAEDKGSRADFRNDNVKPLDIALAEVLYAPAKKEQKEKDNPDKEEWKADAESKRMAA